MNEHEDAMTLQDSLLKAYQLHVRAFNTPYTEALIALVMFFKTILADIAKRNHHVLTEEEAVILLRKAFK